MARNGAGVFAVLNPVLIGALRSSSAVNANFSDAGTAISDSLPADGQAAMTGQFRAAPGTSATSPGISWASDRNVGFRRRSDDGMSWVTAGVDRFYNDDTGKFFATDALSVAGASSFTGAVTGVTDPFKIAALSTNGLARRTGTNLWSADQTTTNISFVRDNRSTLIPLGYLMDVHVPFTCTITGIGIAGDQTGSLVMDIYKDTYANYPPTSGDGICASSKPTITSATSYADTTLAGWTTSIAAGDILRFNIDSLSGFTRLSVTLNVKRYT